MAAELKPSLEDEARHALSRVQEYDPKSLVREAELGSRFAFKAAVEPTRQVIELLKLLPASQLAYFPDSQLTQIKDYASGFYNLLESVEAFEIETAQPNPAEAQKALVQSLVSQYQAIFNGLYPLISFASARSQDFASLERDARAAVQSARDSATSLVGDLEAHRGSAENILAEVRAVAAEQGVSTQAIHFKNEADAHSTAANNWRSYTIYTAGGLATYAVASLFFHLIPGLEPTNSYRALQLSVSKGLIFAVIAFMLFLCSRNFLSHKHNEIVNRHRQNALATFTALAEATSDAASSDVVLSHAAACIFSPQETGYAKHGSGGDSGPNFQLIPRIGNAGGASS